MWTYVHLYVAPSELYMSHSEHPLYVGPSGLLCGPRMTHPEQLCSTQHDIWICLLCLKQLFWQIPLVFPIRTIQVCRFIHVFRSSSECRTAFEPIVLIIGNFNFGIHLQLLSHQEGEADRPLGIEARRQIEEETYRPRLRHCGIDADHRP